MACNVFSVFSFSSAVVELQLFDLVVRTFSSLSSSFQSSSGDIRTEEVQSFSTNESQRASMTHWGIESQRKSPRHMKAWKVLELKKKIRH